MRCKWRQIMIGEWEEGRAAFQYEIKNDRVEILQWKGSGETAHIPESVMGKPVHSIGRKSFLSNKRLREVFLPGSVKELGDWAFAYCSSLTAVHLSKDCAVFGKGVFLDCGHLERIFTFSQDDREMEGDAEVQRAALLAAAPCALDAPYLLTPLEAGSREWLEKWDVRLMQVMELSDREGYSKTLLCGEEDYGSKENNLDFFLSQKRKSKVRLAMLRLLHAEGLLPQMRIFLETYLRSHTKGCGQEETWRVVLEDYGTRKEYYDLLFEIEALTRDNFDAALRDMGTELTEMKAYLLKRREECFGNNEFFDSFAL